MWVEYSTEILDGKRYYINRGIALLEQELDLELLSDIKDIFHKRTEKRIHVLKEKFENEEKDATEKQIKFANDLNFQLNNEKNKYKLNQYSKREISEIINILKRDLRERTYKEPAKVINLAEFRKKHFSD